MTEIPMFATLALACLGGKLIFGEKGVKYGLLIWLVFWFVIMPMAILAS